MIWIYSFARSGSSLFQQFLAKVLSYDVVYEPFGFVPKKIPTKNNHAFIRKWFTGAPPTSEVEKYKIEDFYLANIPHNRLNSPALDMYKRELRVFFKDIYENYGNNTVTKFINPHANVEFLHNIFKELGIPSKYIIFKRDPFEIAYSFYRRGGFQRLSYWYYERLYEYRKRMYPDNILFHRAKTPLDKWMATVLADYQKLDEAYEWLQTSGIDSTLVHYESFLRDPIATFRRIGHDLRLTISDDILTHVTKTYELTAPNKFDISKINLGTSDPLFIKLVRETCKHLSLPYPDHYPSTLPPLRAHHLRYLFNNHLLSHPFIRVYEALKRRIKRRKLFLQGFYYSK